MVAAISIACAKELATDIFPAAVCDFVCFIGALF